MKPQLPDDIAPLDSADRLAVLDDEYDLPVTTFSNYSFVDRADRSVQYGRNIDEMRTELLALTGGWPKRVGSRLFACTPEYEVRWLSSCSDLFAWVEPQAKVSWGRGEGMVSREVFFRHLQSTAERFDSIETVPHFPGMSGICYIHPPLAKSDRSHLDWLLKRFSPMTPEDGKLIRAFFLSLFWGGHPGSQPAWLFTGHDGDEQGGRGLGKSKIVEMAALLLGGMIEVSPREDITKIKKRLLSAGAMDKRIARIDNVKDQKFSWADLEALITSPAISGHQMHKGESQRPNTLTWVLTLNGARLSKDMAQRSIIVQLQRPKYNPTWEAETREFIEKHRWQIIGDIGMSLTGSTKSTGGESNGSFSRWAAWEAAVLARVDHDGKARALVATRQMEVDDDAEEADLVAAQFRDEIRALGHDPECGCFFIKAADAATWLSKATRERWPTNKASAKLATLGIPELSKKKTGGRPGWQWLGKEAPAAATRIRLEATA